MPSPNTRYMFTKDPADIYSGTVLDYNDFIMGAIASQITCLTIVYSTVYSGADYSRVTGDFPAHMASNAENVSIWWRHHGLPLYWVIDVPHCHVILR